MPGFDQYTLYHVLHGEGVPLRGSADLGDGIVSALWERDDDTSTRYETPTHHTLSLYLDGGTQTGRRVDGRLIGLGGPGALCIMPHGVTSDWQVRGWIRLFHLYIPRSAFDRAVVEGLDADPARVELLDRTYTRDPLIERMVRDVMLPLDWNDPADRVATSHAARALIATLVSRFTDRPARALKAQGGLAPAVRRRVADFVEASLDQPLSIDDLAAVAGLSPFHFARAFKRSVGEGPHRYVLRRRIALAQDLIRQGRLPLAEIAVVCGFNSQSHFTQRFREVAGVTPGAFAALEPRSGVV
jgi:AraC family transcriptional regulator